MSNQLLVGSPNVRVASNLCNKTECNIVVDTIVYLWATYMYEDVIEGQLTLENGGFIQCEKRKVNDWSTALFSHLSVTTWNVPECRAEVTRGDHVSVLHRLISTNCLDYPILSAAKVNSSNCLDYPLLFDSKILLDKVYEKKEGAAALNVQFEFLNNCRWTPFAPSWHVCVAWCRLELRCWIFRRLIGAIDFY